MKEIWFPWIDCIKVSLTLSPKLHQVPCSCLSGQWSDKLSVTSCIEWRQGAACILIWSQAARTNNLPSIVISFIWEIMSIRSKHGTWLVPIKDAANFQICHDSPVSATSFLRPTFSGCLLSMLAVFLLHGLYSGLMITISWWQLYGTKWNTGHARQLDTVFFSTRDNLVFGLDQVKRFPIWRVASLGWFSSLSSSCGARTYGSNSYHQFKQEVPGKINWFRYNWGVSEQRLVVTKCAVVLRRLRRSLLASPSLYLSCEALKEWLCSCTRNNDYKIFFRPIV